MTYGITIVNIKDFPDAVYIGRGSVLGNPFPISRMRTRDQACDQYDDYFYARVKEDTEFFAELVRINNIGHNNRHLYLGCFCVPNRCHGETIKSFLEQNQDVLDDFLI